jgi:hypothetical protein
MAVWLLFAGGLGPARADEETPSLSAWRDELERLPAMRMLWCAVVLDRETREVLRVELKDLRWSRERARCVVRSLLREECRDVSWPADAADRSWWDAAISRCSTRPRAVYVWDGLRQTLYNEMENGRHSGIVRTRKFGHYLTPEPLRGLYIYSRTSVSVVLENWAITEGVVWDSPYVCCGASGSTLCFIFETGHTVPDHSIGLRGDRAAFESLLQTEHAVVAVAEAEDCFWATSVVEWLPSVEGTPPIPRLSEQWFSKGTQLKFLVLEAEPLPKDEEINDGPPSALLADGITMYDEVTREQWKQTSVGRVEIGSALPAQLRELDGVAPPEEEQPTRWGWAALILVMLVGSAWFVARRRRHRDRD